MMNRLDTAQIIKDAKSIDDLWDNLANILGQYDVSSFLYGAGTSLQDLELNGPTKALFVRSNYPKEYLDHYDGEAFLDDDLTVDLIAELKRPVFWHHEDLWEEATPQQKRQSEIDNDFGLEVGVSIPFYFGRGAHFSGMGLATQDLTAEQCEQMWAANGDDIVFAMALVHDVMHEKFSPGLVGLSPREKEVLEWLSIGLRPDQIAFKMKIGYRTVDKFINNAKRKLKANTRDQAIARSLLLNAVQP